MTDPQDCEMDLASLNLSQLLQLKGQVEQQICLLQESLKHLKVAHAKYEYSSESLNGIKPETEGKTILMPLTSSLYVPAKLANVSKVLVDIGTGYFVEKSIDDAKDYINRKLLFVKEQMEKVQNVLMGKIDFRKAVMEVLDIKAQPHEET